VCSQLDSQSILINLLRKTKAELIMHRIGRPDDFLCQVPSNKSHKSTRMPLFPVKGTLKNRYFHQSSDFKPLIVKVHCRRKPYFSKCPK